MKTKIMLALIAACFAINAFAEGITASLQSGDKLSVYYGTSAFKEAYAAAQDGDVITLSLGSFTNLGETVSKSITIYGTYGFTDSNCTSIGQLSVSAAKVKVEGVYISQLHPNNSSELIIRSCCIGSLTADEKYDKILVEQCYVSSFSGQEYAENFTFMNSVINSINIHERYTPKAIGYMTNCLVYENNMYFHAIYKNCILGYYNIDIDYNFKFTTPSQFYNTVFFNEKYTTAPIKYSLGTDVIESDNQSLSAVSMFGTSTLSYPDIPTNVPSGSDGTSVGPNGGIGFNKYPTIPRITQSEISNTADESGNIHVRIEATTQR